MSDHRLPNIVFSAIVAVCLCSVLGVHGASVLPIFDMPTKSQLEGRNYTEFPEINVKSVSSGDAQSNFESYIADHVVARDDVMLGNAAIQRSFIRVANAPFGYDVYPTFYGSGSLVYDPAAAVIESPIKQKSNSVEHLEGMAKRFSEFMDRHADKRFAFYFVERVSTSQASPAYPLVTGVADYTYFKEHFIDNLPETCAVFDGSYDDTDEFFEDHFTTDHHWQVQGAAKAYQQIVKAFGKDPIEFEGYQQIMPNGFYGAMAREGLCVEGEGSALYDAVYDRSPLQVTVGGVSKDESYIDEGYGEHPEEFKIGGKYGSAYAQWFHAPTKPIVLVNDSVDSGSLLIVGDSSTDNCERFYAENYHTVYKIDSRYIDFTLDEFLAEHEVDDVLFMFNETQYDKGDVKAALKSN